MTTNEAIEIAKSYAEDWGVPWIEIKKCKPPGKWWYLWTDQDARFEFEVDTGDGEAFVHVDPHTPEVSLFEYHPQERKFLLPLWAAYPTYTSVTIGWRMGYGENYRYAWHTFYASLSETEKMQYKQKYPPPADEDRCWQDFYKYSADTAAADE